MVTGRWTVHEHSLTDVSCAAGSGVLLREFQSEGRAMAYVDERCLVEVWRERGAASIEVHCLVEYREISLQERDSPSDPVRFGGWADLAEYMHGDDLVFSDGSEPCSSLAEFVSMADAASVCWMDDPMGGRLGLYSSKRPR